MYPVLPELSIVTPQDIVATTGYALPRLLEYAILQDCLIYQELLSYDEYELDYRKMLETPLTVSGKHRHDDWESGWGENLKAFQEMPVLTSLIPKYHSKYDVAKINGKIVHTRTPLFDYKLNSYFVDAAINHYYELYKPRNIFELGCGPAYHIYRMQKYQLPVNWYGLDWATTSQDIIREINLDNIHGRKFDFFNPSLDVSMEGSIVYTVAAFEQLGSKFYDVLRFIAAQKPKLVIQFEPIKELMDTENNILDRLNVEYMTKRGYLDGYLRCLRTMQDYDYIKILEQRRLNYGSKFIEGHSLIVWQPL